MKFTCDDLKFSCHRRRQAGVMVMPPDTSGMARTTMYSDQLDELVQFAIEERDRVLQRCREEGHRELIRVCAFGCDGEPFDILHLMQEQEGV